MAEVFDRPTAYSLKFAIDQFGEAYRLKPVYAVVMGDYWFYRDGTNHDRRRVLSIGGPKVNNLTSEILTSGEVIRSERSWVIARSNRRYVIYGDDPSDTLAAMKVFAEQELLKYLQWAWELS